MTSQQRGLRVASVIFGIFAVGHIIRLVTKAEVTIGGSDIGLWLSVVAVFVGGALSIWLWRLSAS